MSKTEDIADVCIIGAGLAGGIMGYELSSRGAKVVLLEAGPRHDPQTRFLYMEELLRGKKPWKSHNPERDVYTNSGEMEYKLNDNRVKAVGGTTLHWGGLTLRLHATDFKMKSLYGLADDWPISYEELEPYYAKAEIALGVAGIADNPFASYRSTDFPLPPFPFSYSDKIFKKGCDKLGVVMHHTAWARNSIPYQNRPSCQAFATCGTYGICPIFAQYTVERHINLAEGTGNALVITDANVSRINVDKSRRVVSVSYVKSDKIEHEQKAHVFVLAAHAVESARLLLLSKSSRFPDGLANTSGMVGKNFMEHLYVRVTARLKERVFPFRIGFHTAESDQFRVSKRRDEIGSFKMGFENNTPPTPFDIVLNSGEWGSTLADEIRESFGQNLGIATELEQLPDEKNSITLDPSVKDCFGNPAPRITYSIGNYERETAERAVDTMEKIFDALEADEIIHGGRDAKKDIRFASHHMGTCRMGDDPEESVVDKNLRTHDVDNLFIAGSSVFVTGAAVQPSLTITALAIRAAEYVSKRFK